MSRSTLVMFSLLLPSALTAQRPDTGPEKGLSRLTLEATLLGGAPIDLGAKAPGLGVGLVGRLEPFCRLVVNGQNVLAAQIGPEILDLGLQRGILVLEAALADAADARVGVDAHRRRLVAGQQRRQEHRIAAGMGRADQFLGVGAGLVGKA